MSVHNVKPMLPSSCENSTLFRHGPPLLKNHEPPFLLSLREPICKDIDARNEPVSLQMGYPNSLSTCLSIEKNKED